MNEQTFVELLYTLVSCAAYISFIQIGSIHNLNKTLCYALKNSGRDIYVFQP